MSIRSSIGAILAAVVYAAGGWSAEAAPKAPVVVELFTSQGCSSCPPADEYLGKLAARPDVVALSLHVDYWDYIGWKDPFASPANTRRQRMYAQTLNRSFVYTPQMVVNGVFDVRGSSPAAVEQAITAARAANPIDVALDSDGKGGIVVHIPAADFSGSATVWLAGYDRKRETPVTRGENADRIITNYNVVRVLTPIGTWTGKRLEIPVLLAGMTDIAVDGCAVIIQSDMYGPILGAAILDLGR